MSGEFLDKNGKKSKRVSLVMLTQLIEDIDKIAEKHTRCRSDMMRVILSEYVDKQQREK